MASLVQYGRYGVVNTADTTTNGFYGILFVSDAYTLKNNTTIDGKNISVSEISFKTQCLFSM